MNTALNALLLQTPPAGAPQPVSPFPQIVMLVCMFAAFYFFLIAPQRKQQKALAKFQSELKVGDPVMTTAGIFGKVVSLQETKATVQVAEGVRLVFLRSALLQSDEAGAENLKASN